MKELIKALAAFQQECPVIAKDGTAKVKTQSGADYSYKYADLPSIVEVIKPILQKCGLSFIQPLDLIDGVRVIRTKIFHIESGEAIESTVDVPIVSFKGMNDYQALGSGITYLRRYALSSILGIVTDEDIDAVGEQNGATAKETPKAKDDLEWIADKDVYRYSEKIKAGEYNGMTADEFIVNLRRHFKVNKKHEEALRTDFEFEQTLNQ